MNPGDPLLLGSLLDGRYRIKKILGQGGMGRVYLANDTRLANRPVAAKEMILGDGIQEKKAIKDFNREASVLASLSHPNIPQVIDFFAEHGRHYLVMEYVAGGDLQHRLDALGPRARIGENQVLKWARQILDVLHFLHIQKPPLIYRDLKPGNVMIDQQGRAMLVDFGIARFLPPGGRGTQIGSVGYAPPEQYLGKLEPRSDLYALAATMHHLLTGRDPQLEPPFSFPPVRQIAPDISAATERVVMSALEQAIDKRPCSAQEMRDQLPDPDAGASPNQSSLIPGAGASRIGGSLGQMPTIVLAQPVTPAPSGAAAIQVLSGADAKAKTKRGLVLAPVAVSPAVSATGRTRDLGLKAHSAAPPPVSPKALLPAARKLISSLGRLSLTSATNLQKSSPVTGPDAPPKLTSIPQPAVKAPEARRVQMPTSRPAEKMNGTVGARAGTLSKTAAAALIASSDGARFALTGNRIVIGRGRPGEASVDVDLSTLRQGADRVSQRHAEIIARDGEYFIRDLGSLNGTHVAGRGRLGRDQLYRLRDRDEVLLGAVKLEFRRG